MNNLLDPTGRPVSEHLARVLDEAGPGACGLFLACFYTRTATAYAVGLWFNPELRKPPAHRLLLPRGVRVPAAGAPRSACPGTPAAGGCRALSLPTAWPGLVGVGCFADPLPVLALLPRRPHWPGPRLGGPKDLPAGLL